MKTLGLLGGMSWESTSLYYTLINKGIQQHLGGFHSAKIIMVSIDFHEIERLMIQNNWDDAGALLAEQAQRIEAAGADVLLICTNTMHKVASMVQKVLSIPLLHLADATAKALIADRRSRVGLLGTRFTMEETFYRGQLIDNHGLDVIIPQEKDREIVHRIIFEELCKGHICDASRQEYLRIINDLTGHGAEAVILGCTEIGLLLDSAAAPVPLYDTTRIHAEAAVNIAVGSGDE